jgi:hypothetical protein
MKRHGDKLTIYRLEKRISELENRLYVARKVDQEVSLWKWNSAPSWLRSNVAMATAIGGEIVLYVTGDVHAEPETLHVKWVKRKGA